jgi:type I restriction enzyme R subunit
MEKNLEDLIEQRLQELNDYERCTNEDVNKDTLFLEDTLIRFLRTSQEKEWNRYVEKYGDKAASNIIKRLVDEINNKGLLKTFREGIHTVGFKFEIAIKKPQSSLNEEHNLQYLKNIFTVVRQVHFSKKDPDKSVDMMIFLNGMPIFTLELKNEYTGQDYEDSIKQYQGRDFNELMFRYDRRSLVFFGIDTEQAWMTTLICGKDTKFLPFNQGSNGAGNPGGKGNPINQYPDDFDTAYIWRDIFTKDSIIDFIFNHIQTEKEKNKKSKDAKVKTIFPRYHQLDSVRKMLADVRARGPGGDYLIQHSAGSGKSNSIAWLAYSLYNMQDAEGHNYFDSIIVITDRIVLDRQLRNTITQFNHQSGTVVTVKGTSQELKDAINTGRSIITTTLQKFPNIYDEVSAGKRTFAVICDEAHGSQYGEQAKTVRIALGEREEIEQIDDEDLLTDKFSKLRKELEAQGHHKNLSFFAFTATPKGKTIELFGTMRNGEKEAFHTYSMMQAIEEGFILDVLENYRTYEELSNIIKKIPDDPLLLEKPTVKAIRKYMQLHPDGISQKTEIMMGFFRDFTMKEMGGNAKAMLVCPSRPAAVKYIESFQKYIRDNRITDVKVLVAFTPFKDKDGNLQNEGDWNIRADGTQIKGSAIETEFENAYNILIVADKYQTGFDQPLLQTMFVDKKLGNVKAVQTLSRVNRTAPGKDKTYILDFINKRDTIEKSFEKYYTKTRLPKGVESDSLYDVIDRLQKYEIWGQSDIEEYGKIAYDESIPDSEKGPRLVRIHNLCKERFEAIDDPDVKACFITDARYFLSFYSFATQIEAYRDPYNQFLYIFLKKFLNKIKEKTIKINVEDLVEYGEYRLKPGYVEGKIVLQKVEGTEQIKGSGGYSINKKEKKLSEIVDDINRKFGISTTEGGKLVEQFIADVMKDADLSGFAKRNDETGYNGSFDRKFEGIVVNRSSENEEMMDKLMSDPEYSKAIKDLVCRLAFERMKGKKKDD